MTDLNISTFLCKKFAISYMVFTPEFKIVEYTQDILLVANTTQGFQIGVDLRDFFWEFVGVQEQLNKVLKKEQENFSLPLIYKNNIYYNIEVELLEKEGESFFVCYIWKKSEQSLQYFEKVQKLNKQTLQCQSEKNAQSKKQDYYDLLNKEFISFHVNCDGIITQTNDVCECFFDTTKEEFLGKHFSEFFYTREAVLKEEKGQIFYAKNRFNEEVCFHTDVIPIKENNRVCESILICFDITYLKNIEKDLEYAVAHDSLTGIPNRTFLLKKIDEAIERSQKKSQEFALFFLDLNKFKAVNDSYGHHAGDMLLKHIASLLKNFIREGDTVARIGGDEFVVLFDHVDALYIQNIVHRLEDLQKNNPLHYTQEDTILTNFSIGYSLYPKDAQDAQSLLQSADKEMYKAKKCSP